MAIFLDKAIIFKYRLHSAIYQLLTHALAVYKNINVINIGDKYSYGSNYNQLQLYL